MGSFAELDPFAHLSRLGDLTKKESKTFGFSLTIKVSFDKRDTAMDSFPGVGTDCSILFKISFPSLYQINLFWEGSIVKINEKGWIPILFDTTTETKGTPYIFFRASPRIAGILSIVLLKPIFCVIK